MFLVRCALLVALKNIRLVDEKERSSGPRVRDVTPLVQTGSRLLEPELNGIGGGT